MRLSGEFHLPVTTLFSRGLAPTVFFSIAVLSVGQALGQEPATVENAQSQVGVPSGSVQGETPPPCPPCPTCPKCPDCQPCPPPPAQALETLEAMKALTAASPERRAQGARKLAQLGDAAVDETLIYVLLRDPNEDVQATVADALFTLASPMALEVLSTELRNRARPLPVRQRIAERFAERAEDQDFDLLWSLRNDDSEAFRAHISQLLESRFPARYAQEKSVGKTLDDRGRLRLMPGMGLHGAFFMTALADVAGGEPGPLTVLSGASVGAVTPYLLTMNTPVALNEAAWMNSTTTWGLMAGGLTAGSFPISSDGILLSMMGGQAVGLTAGILTHDGIPYTAGDMAYINAAGLMGFFTAMSGTLMAETEDERWMTAVLEVGIGGGLLAGSAITQNLELSYGDGTAISFSTAGGFLAGFLTSQLLLGDEAEGSDQGAGTMLGGVTAFVGSSYLSQHIAPQPADVYATTGATGVGLLSGHGLGLLLDPRSVHPRLRPGLTLAGGVGAGVTSALLSSEIEYDGGDFYGLALGMGWGLWQGNAFGGIIYSNETQQTGLGLVSLGAGSLAGAVVAQHYQTTPLGVGMVTTGGAWGGWVSGWSAYILQKHGAGLSDKHLLLSTLLGADVGLGTALFAVSETGGVPLNRLGWTNAGGLLGMGLGTAVASVGGAYIAEANVAGSTIGLAAGYFFSEGLSHGSSATHTPSEASHSNLLHGVQMWPTVQVVPTEGGQQTLMLTLQGIN